MVPNDMDVCSGGGAHVRREADGLGGRCACTSGYGVAVRAGHISEHEIGRVYWVIQWACRRGLDGVYVRRATSDGGAACM